MEEGGGGGDKGKGGGKGGEGEGNDAKKALSCTSTRRKKAVAVKREVHEEEEEEEGEEAMNMVVGSGRYQLVGKGIKAAKRVADNPDGAFSSSSSSTSFSGKACGERKIVTLGRSSGMMPSISTAKATTSAAAAGATGAESTAAVAAADAAPMRVAQPSSNTIRLSINDPLRPSVHFVTPSPQTAPNKGGEGKTARNRLLISL